MAIQISQTRNNVGFVVGCISAIVYSYFKICHQREFPLRKSFMPVCVGRGLDLDLRVCPPPAALKDLKGFVSIQTYVADFQKSKYVVVPLF